MVSLRDEGGNLYAYLTHSLTCLARLLGFARLMEGRFRESQATSTVAEPHREGLAMVCRGHCGSQIQNFSLKISYVPLEAALAE